MEYRTLKQLPEAKRELRGLGYRIRKEQGLLNSRPHYAIINDAARADSAHVFEKHVTDYGLLEAASYGCI